MHVSTPSVDHSLAENKPHTRPNRVRAASFYDLKSLKTAACKRQRVDPDSVPGKKPAAGHRFDPFQAPFKTFKTQQAAFDFLDKQTCSELLRTFACETAATGQREFIVTSAELFWQHYLELQLAARHHYEIIRQSRPCHLYFDLEYQPECNPELDGPGLVELLLSGVRSQLEVLFDIPWDPSCVLELDSSTPSKFSRHLIIRLPGRLAFADVCHAGRFARCVLLWLLQQGLHCSKFGQMLVLNREGGLTSFVDMGVYTRNRAFRLYLSSKYGKAAVLRLTHRFRGASICPKAAFHESLVSVLQHPVEPAAGRSRRSGSGSGRQLLSLLRVEDDGQHLLLQLPPAWQQVPMLQLRPLEHPGQHTLHLCPATATGPGMQHAARTHFGPTTQQAGASGVLQGSVQPCFGPSPYSLLDQFIVSVSCAGGVQGEIRSWLVQPGSSCVLYNIKHNRWCGNIGRAHQSNGIFFVVDLAAGVYCQKCYDPECRQYRSNYMPLPSDAWHAYRHLLAPPSAQTVPQPQHVKHTSAATGTAMSTGNTPTRFPAEHRALPPPAQGHGHVHSRQPSSESAAAAPDEDEQCLQLLLQYEQQQQQQQYNQGQPVCHTHCHLQQLPQQQQPLQLQQHSCNAGGGAPSGVSPAVSCGGGGGREAGEDDDELMLQLLCEVEQRVAQQRHVAAS